MRRKLLVLVFCTLVLTGCWNRRELNTLGIVYGIGVDKDNETGELILTTQVVRAGALKQEGPSEEAPIEIVTARGDTAFEALRKISMEFDRKPFYAQNKVLVIDEQLAREGIMPMLDFFKRDHEMRSLVWVLIAKNTRARDILGVEKGLEDIQAVYLENIIEISKWNAKATTVNLLEFIKKVSASGIHPIAGPVEIIEERNLPAEEKMGLATKGVKLSGTAVFKGDKLVGYLDEIETRGLNWATGKVKSGIIHVPSIDGNGKDKQIAIEIKRARASIKPEIKDGKFFFTIEVKAEGDVGAQQGRTDTSDIALFEKLEKELGKGIEKEIRMAIDKVQKEYRSDIFGFGSALNKKYPKEWNQVKDDWEDIFPRIQYSIKVDARLRRTGLILKPIMPAE
ncbi:Ger(x)C family spore germination protein [Geosporobacter ferrireducens]|uniref:Uncharacterized protein n=1 Tax=Geosporobacter ferrireducens TaxID=1424294 RepID=A0A1D8GFF3_9FIRM|nr:Ger(x)C family spore germination protein [Geosporobacter ferrireducens]AOT69631.1 hypothetical protein Gferi_08600 [Geosporobacter ferrireducens]MTI54666.1 Ger(x)C family spore germination protein [Geosporobacter ferrireducens]